MRFALSTAGLAAVSLAGTAYGATVNWSHGLDRWAGEHSWEVHSSVGGVTVASMFISGGYITYGGAAVSTAATSYSTLSSHFADIHGTMSLANGTYHVAMHDAYGDGWAWGSYVGGLAIGTGSASFPSSAGSYVSFSFTVVPAPGAMALLGLAGLAARRRRRD
jgi:MYXO-CTERM domain-containing protein